MFNRVLNLSNRRLENLGGIHNTAFLIIILSHSVFYSFFIKDIFSYVGLSYCLGSSFCITMLTMDSWPEYTKKYHGMLWFLSLFFVLPFPYFMEFFSNLLTSEFVIRFSLSILILSILVDWIVFIIMFSLAPIIAINIVAYVEPKGLDVFLSNDNLLEIIFLLKLMIIVTSILMKKRQESIDSRFHVARSIAGILSHEIRTPLTKLHLNLDILQDMILKEHDHSKIQNVIKRIINSENQISGFVNTTLLKLEEEKPEELEKLYISEEISSIIDSYMLDNTEHFEVNIKIDNDFEFLGDRVQFRHIIFNLLKNSIYHMSSTNNPTITISTKNMFDMNILIFEDNGTGIDTKLLDNIFNIYFTTKLCGSGIGLYFCKKVVEKFGGYITCESQKNKYTKFNLYFPKVLRSEK